MLKRHKTSWSFGAQEILYLSGTFLDKLGYINKNTHCEFRITVEQQVLCVRSFHTNWFLIVPSNWREGGRLFVSTPNKWITQTEKSPPGGYESPRSAFVQARPTWPWPLTHDLPNRITSPLSRSGHFVQSLKKIPQSFFEILGSEKWPEVNLLDWTLVQNYKKICIFARKAPLKHFFLPPQWATNYNNMTLLDVASKLSFCAEDRSSRGCCW